MKMNYEEMTTEEVVKYIETEISKGRSCKDIEINDFGVTERTIRKRLLRKGIKIDTKGRNTSNITSKKPVVSEEISIPKVEKQEIKPIFNEVEMSKIKYYIDNFELIKNIVDGNKNKTDTNRNEIKVTSKETTTTSLRINKEIYDMIKERSKRDDIKIGDIINRALLDYLKNYI